MRVHAAGRELEVEHAVIASGDPGAPLVVFLHEGLGSVAGWRDFPRRLCEAGGYRGLVFSRPGYGRSTPRAPDERWGVAFLHAQARDVLPAILREAGVTVSPWLFGHSDGGSIALIYAATNPGRVAGVIALAPHIFVEDVTVAGAERLREDYLTTDLRARLGRYHDDVDSAFWGWNDVWLDPDFKRWSIEGLLPSITCPVLAVQGHDDTYGTMAQIDGIAAAVPRARLLKLRRCGHSPHRDQPAVVADATIEFIARHSPDCRRLPP